MRDDIVSENNVTPGEQLRAAREARGLTLEEVAKTLHILPSNIRALEENRFNDVLKGATFVRGYLRTYASLMNLDGEALVAEYNNHFAPPETKVAGHVVKKPSRLAYSNMTMPARRSRKRFIPLLLLFVAVLSVVAGLVFAVRHFWFSDAGTVSDISQVQAAPLLLSEETPLPELQASVSEDAVQSEEVVSKEIDLDAVVDVESQEVVQADAGVDESSLKDRLEFELSGDSWIEVRDGQGNRLFADLARSGRDVSLEGKSPFNIIIGDGRSVTLRYNGRPLNYSFARNGYAEITVP